MPYVLFVCRVFNTIVLSNMITQTISLSIASKHGKVIVESSVIISVWHANNYSWNTGPGTYLPTKVDDK